VLRTFAVFVGFATVDGVMTTGAAPVTPVAIGATAADNVAPAGVPVVVPAAVPVVAIGAATTAELTPAFAATGAAAVATKTPPPSPAPLVMIGFGPELIDEFTVISGFA
jgi:hypothetical protein